MSKGQRFDAERLRALMEGLGLNAETMAERIRQESGEKITGETIRRWLLGKNYPQVRHLHAFADAFGIDIRIFFPDPKESDATAQKPAKRRRPARP